MYISSLSKEQIAQIYETHLCSDFPPDERKTLEILLNAFDAGAYLGFGLYENELLGYAFFVQLGNDYLLDYLAIVRGKRDLGLGSHFLQLIAKQFSQASSLLVEVEEPDKAPDQAAYVLRSRRKAFYLRNGFSDTGVNAEAFGVNFRLLEPQEKPRSKEEIKALYLALYQTILPPSLFENNVIIP